MQVGIILATTSGGYPQSTFIFSLLTGPTGKKTNSSGWPAQTQVSVKMPGGRAISANHLDFHG